MSDVLIKNFWTYPDDTTTLKDIIFLFAKPDGSGGFTIRQQTKEDLFNIASNMVLKFNPSGNTTVIVFDDSTSSELQYNDATRTLSFAGLNIVDLLDEAVLRFNPDGASDLIVLDDGTNARISYTPSTQEIEITDALNLKLNSAASIEFTPTGTDSILVRLNDATNARLSFNTADNTLRLLDTSTLELGNAAKILFRPAAGNNDVLIFNEADNSRMVYNPDLDQLSLVGGISKTLIGPDNKLQFAPTGTNEMINFDEVSNVRLAYLALTRVLWYENAGGLVISDDFTNPQFEIQNNANDVTLNLGGDDLVVTRKKGVLNIIDTDGNNLKLEVDLTENDEDVNVVFGSTRHDYDPLSDPDPEVAYREDYQGLVVNDPSNGDVVDAPNARISRVFVRIVSPIANLSLDFPENPQQGDICSFSLIGGTTTSIAMTAPGVTSIDSPIPSFSARDGRQWIYDLPLDAWLRLL